MQAKLKWRHHYQGLLEEYYALGAPPATANGEPLSLSDQARQEQGRSLESKLAAYERKYSIEPRWLQGSRKYEAAAGQRKRFMIQKLQANIAARFLDHYGLQRQLDTAAYRERTSLLSSLRRRMDAIAAKVGEELIQLQRWHAAPGQYGGPAYNLQQLTAADLLAADVLPWQRRSAAAGLLERKLAALSELQERLRRCNEETDIVRREAQDMHVFYQYYTEQVELAMATVEHISISGSEVPGAAVLGHAGVSAVANAYKAGRVQLLRTKLVAYQRQRDAAADLLTYLCREQAELGSDSDPASADEDTSILRINHEFACIYGLS